LKCYVFSCYTLTGTVSGSTATGTISGVGTWTATMSGSTVSVNVNAGSAGTCGGSYSTTQPVSILISSTTLLAVALLYSLLYICIFVYM